MTNYQQDTLALIPGTTPREKYEALQLMLTWVQALEDTMAFCKEHRVEVLLQADMQHHCFIDYKTGDPSYSVQLDGFTAMMEGVAAYKKRNP